MKFIEVDPDEIPNIRETHRGRVSYPILKSFLETGMVLVQLDRTGIQQSLQSLSSSLNAYIRNHQLPIKMFTRRGQIFLMRLDTVTDAQGNVAAEPKNLDVIETSAVSRKAMIGKAPQELLDSMDEIPDVDGDEVENRYLEEKGQTTK